MNLKNAQFHLHHKLTMANLIAVMRESFPELDVSCALHKDDLPPAGEYCGSYFTHIFCPFIKTFLNSDQQHPTLLGTRLFNYLEDMATSHDEEVSTLLAYTILEHLNLKELVVAEIYLGPKTKEVLKQIEEFWSNLEKNLIFVAIDQADILQVKALLNQGVDINYPNKDGCSPLFVAVQKNLPAIVELLIEYDADIHQQNHYKATPLDISSLNGHTQIVRLLLKLGAQVNNKGSGDWTALHHATHGGFIEIVELILAHNPDLSAQADDGRTALHCTAERGHAEIIRLLLKCKADVNTQEIYIIGRHYIMLRGMVVEKPLNY